MSEPALIMVPGYNEPPKHFKTLSAGRNGIPGFEALGIRCIDFPQEDERLHERIDRFGHWLDDLHKRGEVQFPVALLGYSLGALVVRGYLRAFPQRADRISHTVMLGGPNWGITDDLLPVLAKVLRVPDQAMDDMDLDSDFMRWYNGTGGHWKDGKKGKDRIWELDEEPIVGPAGAKMLSIVGAVPRFGGDTDGFVWNDSSTLGGRIQSVTITDPMANHMNLCGIFNLLFRVTRGFKSDDRIWPQVRDAVAGFLGHSRDTQARSST